MIHVVNNAMDTKKHSHLPVFILLSIVFIGFIFLASYLSYRQKVDDSVINVGLKWLHSAQFAGMYVAKTQSLYEKEGLEVEFSEPTEESRSTIESLLAGKSDFVIVTPLELLDHIAKGDPVKAVAAIYQESPTVIASLPESGIVEPKDLKNKTLGTSRTENFSFSMYKFLVAKYKVPANSVDYKNIGFNVLDDLLSKKVDAVSLYRTKLYLPEGYPEQSFNIIKPEDHDIHMYNDIIVTTDKMIQEKPEQVQAFVSATIKGWEFALDYQEEALDMVIPYTSDRQEDYEFEKYILSVSTPLIRPEGVKNIGDMKAGRWLEMYHLYKSTVLSPEFDVSKGYTIDFLP